MSQTVNSIEKHFSFNFFRLTFMSALTTRIYIAIESRFILFRVIHVSMYSWRSADTERFARCHSGVEHFQSPNSRGLRGREE